jgi:hypothetical protein
VHVLPHPPLADRCLVEMRIGKVSLRLSGGSKLCAPKSIRSFSWDFDSTRPDSTRPDDPHSTINVGATNQTDVQAGDGDGRARREGRRLAPGGIHVDGHACEPTGEGEQSSFRSFSARCFSVGSNVAIASGSHLIETRSTMTNHTRDLPFHARAREEVFVSPVRHLSTTESFNGSRVQF